LWESFIEEEAGIEKKSWGPTPLASIPEPCSCVQEKCKVEDQVGEAHRELGRERQSRRVQEEERRAERDLWERDQIHSNQLLQELSREVANPVHQLLGFQLISRLFQ
jgi:hypothetical protein